MPKVMSCDNFHCRAYHSQFQCDNKRLLDGFGSDSKEENKVVLCFQAIPELQLSYSNTSSQINMSLRSSRSLASAARAVRALPASSSRAFTAAPLLRKEKTPQTSDPTPITAPPQFPAPVDPFNPTPEAAATPKYSEGTKNLVRGVARLMGYNSRASTAIRETGRMMRGIVDAVEQERGFWYTGEWRHLPS